jgi:DNA-binding XRE family transcriptional regulator
MANVDTDNSPKASFSPQEASNKALAIAYLVDRMSRLPQEAMADLAALAPELARCDSQEKFDGITETIREILFPEILGAVRQEALTSDKGNHHLRKRMQWLGERIKQARTAAGFTQSQLAKRASLPQSHISRLESGQHSPSYKTLARIAQALGVAIRELDPAED